MCFFLKDVKTQACFQTVQKRRRGENNEGKEVTGRRGGLEVRGLAKELLTRMRNWENN